MSLKAMYDSIASNYAPANQFGSISRSHDIAIEQIKKAHVGEKKHFKILDLGVGDGEFLKKLHSFLPNAELTGIDISSQMLKVAKLSMPMTTIECSAAMANKFLPAHSQDLILAHFINAYIPIHALFQQAQILSKATGYFSMITTTYDSFPVAQQYLADFIAQETLMSSVVGHYYKSIVKNTTVAANETELLNTFSAYELNIVDHQRIHIPIEIQNIDELTQFGIDGTWFLNTLTIKMLPKNFLVSRLKKFFSHIFTFPYRDTHIIDVILAKK